MGNKLLPFIPLPHAASIAWVCVAALLSACGGGGGGGDSGASTPAGLAPSATLANQCAAVRPNTQDRPGSTALEKAYLRSFVDETYLWYRDVPNLNPAAYATPQDYFAQLKTKAFTPSGLPVDQFHWSQPTTSWDATAAGDADDYGIWWAQQPSNLERIWKVAQVFAGSPAALAGIRRGDQITSVDGVDFVHDNSQRGLAVLNEGLFPTVTSRHQLGFNYQAAITLATARYSFATVQSVQTLATASGNVGYFVFDAHLEKSEDELIAAINQLKASNITDLVIDMRYNGGGLLYVASELAYMVAGPSATNGRVFEKLIHNDKLPSETKWFENTDARGQPLPHLDLRHVTLLVTGDTASASESVINSLRGVDVVVDLMGAPTRGKPYGFRPQNNCGYTYFAIQFKGVNDKGFGDYADGFTPTCSVQEDFASSRDDPSDVLLHAALRYRETRSCPLRASANARAQVLLAASRPPFQLVRPATQELRIAKDRPRR